ncbi:ABC transporter substrate-binding protein [Clostridium folliculivorans]|uniref:Sugar ABC transporter substrate-binding protein n=1 Tax=Clostridium folliculivorans TaxID=2886038 RepID=A0A9W5XYF7_9CLOT|nr:ABC transporter substrate-binding protein [Clostridium folliculivorans]GKU23216.1 sugar ABC transporter substrate-binding protein [Clostridium folliculivorans]GKU29262.1 sugar ABC transporter substrate-binding protein [Clostridium folliculivorans]
MRRCIGILMVVLYTSFLLVGCKQDSKVKDVSEASYEYNILSYAPYTNYLRNQVTEFNKKYPKVKINVNDIKQDSYIKNVNNSIETVDKKPDLVLLTGQELNDMLISNKDIFTAITSDVSSRTKSYSQGRIDEITVNNQIYGFPWDSKPIVMFCNKELLHKFNVNLDDVNTWSMLIDAGKRYYEASGKKENIMVMNEENEKVLVKVLLYQLGVPSENLDMTSGNKNLNKVINLISDLKKNNVLRIDDNFDYFKSPILFGSSNTYMNLEKVYKEGNIFVKDLPAFEPGGNTSVIMEGVNAVFLNNKKDIEILKQFIAEALTDKQSLIKYMSTDGVFPSYVDSYVNSEIDKKIQFLDYDRLWARMSIIETNSKRKKYYYDMSKMIDSYIEQSNKLDVQVNGSVVH